MKRIIRPPVSVLPASALVPEKNLITPPPNQFTHEVVRKLAFYYGDAQKNQQPDGYVEKGNKVVLLVHDGGEHCRVADGRGLYVEVEYAGLRKL